MVKSHNGLKGTKVFACGSSGRNLKNFSRFAGKNPCWGTFFVKLQAAIACYKRLLGQLYQKRYSYTEILTQAFSVNFEKKMNTTINTSTRVPLKQFQIKSLLLRILVLSKRAHAGFIHK